MRSVLTVLAVGLAVALAAEQAPAQGENAPKAAEPAAPAESAEPTGDALSAEEVQKLFTGNTEVAVAMKEGVPTKREYKAFYEANGEYRLQEKSGVKSGGVWFVDPLGRHCFRPGGKNETKCDVILREGDRYIRMRDGGRRGMLSIEKGNPFKL